MKKTVFSLFLLSLNGCLFFDSTSQSNTASSSNNETISTKGSNNRTNNRTTNNQTTNNQTSGTNNVTTSLSDVVLDIDVVRFGNTFLLAKAYSDHIEIHDMNNNQSTKDIFIPRGAKNISIAVGKSEIIVGTDSQIFSCGVDLMNCTEKNFGIDLVNAKEILVGTRTDQKAFLIDYEDSATFYFKSSSSDYSSKVNYPVKYLRVLSSNSGIWATATVANNSNFDLVLFGRTTQTCPRMANQARYIGEVLGQHFYVYKKADAYVLRKCSKGSRTNKMPGPKSPLKVERFDNDYNGEATVVATYNQNQIWVERKKSLHYTRSSPYELDNEPTAFEVAGNSQKYFLAVLSNGKVKTYTEMY